jgi:hypothetical protein
MDEQGGQQQQLQHRRVATAAAMSICGSAKSKQTVNMTEFCWSLRLIV